MFKLSTSSQKSTFLSYPPFLPNSYILNHKPLFQTQSSPIPILSKKTNPSHHSSPSDNKGRWSKDEQTRFIEAIILYGVDWKKVQQHISTRTCTQARSHAQKFLLKLKHCDMIRNRNINLNYSWAKSIQMLKKEFTQREMESILRSVCVKRKLNNKEERKDNVCIIHNDQSEVTTVDEYNEKEDEWRKDNCEYIKTFMESFKVKKRSFDVNDDELYCDMH